MTGTLYVALHEDSRVMRDWGTNPWATARKWARTFGAAGILRADGSYVLLHWDGTRVRRQTWRHAIAHRSVFST